MPRRLIKRYLPDLHRIREHKQLRLFGDRLHDPNLWHLNRRSVAGAVGLGVFMALLPLPGQMILAAAAAIGFRVNLPLAVATVWITNPFTFPPVFYFNYKIGTWVLSTPHQEFAFKLSLDWLMNETSAIWPPLIIGSLLMATVLGITTYALVRLAWRIYILRKRRQVRRASLRRSGSS
jgi:hypothetical protein